MPLAWVVRLQHFAVGDLEGEAIKIIPIPIPPAQYVGV